MSRITRGRAPLRAILVGALVLVAAGVVLYPKLSGQPRRAPETLALGGVVDVLEGEVAASELAGGWPAEVCAGEARHTDLLLAARADGSAATIVDVSALDSISRETLRSRLVEAALDDGGAIAFDLTGVTVRALEGPLDEAVRVQVGPGGVLVSRTPLAAAVEAGGAK
jgi:hypothetical protein